ncbi:hypothetical protein ATY81_22470 [Rhizobium sp. R72]|uniref:hypothetical protein n=1 Tax=unclassified Rhizobium TaxID=2613769 RepID=UPI000B52F7FC|nr:MULTISPECIES: hypothetical protein [unclassified Rhizobium]OWW02400.1 hypothetical protein ATY81_22470 [Rhizobium sp. R72]OWW02534.1 hypothetical protein ATY80_22470 [Rhizobium sp. R711]
MTRPRCAFLEILEELDNRNHVEAGLTGDWSVRYLSRRLVLYDFAGIFQRGVSVTRARKLVGLEGVVSDVAPQTLNSALTEFQENPHLSFYVGARTTIPAIARELMEATPLVPEVMIVETRKQTASQIPDSASSTRLAFVGMETAFLQSPTSFCTGLLSDGDLIHPVWHRDRIWFDQAALAVSHDGISHTRI